MSTSEDIERILLQYPALELETLPGSSVCFKGNVRRQNTWYRIKISLPKFPSLQGLVLHVHQTFRILRFTGGSDVIQPGWTFDDLIEHLPQLAPPTTRTCTEEYNLPEANIFEQVAKLKCDSYRIQLNEACTIVRFSKFRQFEHHHLEVMLPSLQLRSHSLPECVPWAELFVNCTTLSALLQQFLKYLEELREFYENFADIDEMCYVVQPLQPTTKDNWRLFLLRERVFLKLVISDPFSPMASMTLHIIGSTPETEQLRRCYSNGLKNWDSELNIHQNLLRIFDLCFFPMPPGSDAVGIQHIAAPQFCNICYCHQLEGQVPIISCDNPSCSLIFHAICLREWFNTLSDGKTFLDVAFGACPFCKAKLSTSFAEVLDV